MGGDAGNALLAGAAAGTTAAWCSDICRPRQTVREVAVVERVPETVIVRRVRGYGALASVSVSLLPPLFMPLTPDLPSVHAQIIER